MRNDKKGFTLVEVLIAFFLIAIGVLAAAPMFIYATRSNASGADFGTVGAMAVEQMEQLRSQSYSTLTPGGSLANNVTGYSDTSNPDFDIRWTIEPNTTPPNTRIITLRAVSLRQMMGPQREVIMTTLRGD